MEVHRQSLGVDLVRGAAHLVDLFGDQRFGDLRPAERFADPARKVVGGREPAAEFVEEGQHSGHERDGGGHVLQEHCWRPGDEGPNGGREFGSFR